MDAPGDAPKNPWISRTRFDRPRAKQSRFSYENSGESVIAGLLWIVNVQQLRHFTYQCDRAGIHRTHGHRNQYAQERYRELTGWAAPTACGPRSRALAREQKQVDREARLIISTELGHEREQVTAIFLGR